MLSQVRGSSKTARVFLAGVATLFGVALASSASAYVDVDPVFQPLTSSLSGTFDIQDPGNDCFLLICDAGGFDPATDDVVSAHVDFIFFDIEYGSDEIATIELGDGLQGPTSVDGSDRFFFVFYLEHLEANADVLLQLSDHGTLDWTITLANTADAQIAGGTGDHDGSCGDYDKTPFLKAGILKASGSPIPEPTAALMFCLGFGVVGTATRKSRIS